MITVDSFGERFGRLGNQLFQVALLFAIHQRRGHDFYLPHQGESIWNCFDLAILDSGSECLHGFEERYGPYNYDPAVFEQPDGTAYRGYFQSYRYLEDCKESLIRYLRFNDTYRAQAEVYLFALRRRLQRDLVSVHVRRGDYVTHPDNLWGDLPADGYYERVVEAIGNDVAYLVFSDDLPWCRRNLDLGCMEFVDLDPFTSLCLMTRCDVNVVANSSFSWWGAYLNTQGEVYAPSRWLYPDMAPPRDRETIVPPTWRTVPVFVDRTNVPVVDGTATGPPSRLAYLTTENVAAAYVSEPASAPYPSPLPGLHEKLVLTYDATPLQDGAGAQLQRIYGIYAVARLIGASYLHTPLACVGYQGLSALENNNELDPDFHRHLNDVFAIASDVPLSDELYDVTLTQLSLETVEELAGKFDSGSSGGRPILVHLLFPFAIADQFPNCYEVCKEISPFTSPVGEARALRVAIHVRRGEQLAIESPRMLPNSYYIHVAESVAREIDSLGMEFNIEIVSELPSRDVVIRPDLHGIGNRINVPVVISPESSRLDEFDVLPNVVYCLNEPALDGIRRLATADIVVTSRSSFSYLAAILNKSGVVLYHPFWHTPMSSWLTVDPEGGFDPIQFRTAVQSLPEVSGG